MKNIRGTEWVAYPWTDRVTYELITFVYFAIWIILDIEISNQLHRATCVNAFLSKAFDFNVAT